MSSSRKQPVSKRRRIQQTWIFLVPLLATIASAIDELPEEKHTQIQAIFVSVDPDGDFGQDLDNAVRVCRVRHRKDFEIGFPARKEVIAALEQSGFDILLCDKFLLVPPRSTLPRSLSEKSLLVINMPPDFHPAAFLCALVFL